MESPKSGVELERELTCSICTELLYQPLTLLDCLHTFCGSCLKEWFSFQAVTIEKSPNPPAPGSPPFTCPSCRAPVRDTKHSATFVTLLDMLITANPDKARTDADKEDMARKYKPGDQVIPTLNRREQTAGERRAAEEDRRLVDSVREMSLREAGAAQPPPRSRQRRESRSRSTGDTSSEARQRRTRDGNHRQRREEPRRENSDHLVPDEEQRRRRRSESRQRQVEHQSSLRSLISSAELNDRDVEKEIEDFARQIQEEGLLDGLDLDNIDLSRNDELSRKITEAYRRRQRGRSRNQNASRSSNGGNNATSARPAEQSQTEGRTAAAPSGSRSSSQRPQRHGRSASATGHSEDRRRPPTSWPANLEIRDTSGATRQRASSGGRSSTLPSSSTPALGETRPAARSQTDLSLPNTSSDGATRARPSTSQGRRSSSPVTALAPAPLDLPGSSGPNLQSFASRAPHGNPNSATGRSATPPETSQASKSTTPRESRATELSVVHSAVSIPSSSGPTTSGHQRKRSQLYPEPSVQCYRCGKAHIEYEVHYNCHNCSNGQWNICLNCYRTGLGCLYWFGFGFQAWTKWERARKRGEGNSEPPHVLTARRYVPPPHKPGGADGRKTLTMDDPKNRLESGTFCARCFAWTNQCYWRCHVCNWGDWGFCNNCVNQGNSCTHMLLPLTQETSPDRPRSPRSPSRPATASIVTGPSGNSIGPFKPLTFGTTCDICQDRIPLTDNWYHCFQCTSGLINNATCGDYDICISCYGNLVTHGEISRENGYDGWRRCLSGHRMVILGFAEGENGHWRYVDQDLVGGRSLRMESFGNSQSRNQALSKWSWGKGEQKRERLVTKNVKETAPTSDGSTTFTSVFPPDGGMGATASARWPWYPQAGSKDELLFPRWAEIKEIEDMNGEWYSGIYMGAEGMFPAPYVRKQQDN